MGALSAVVVGVVAVLAVTLEPIDARWFVRHYCSETYQNYEWTYVTKTIRCACPNYPRPCTKRFWGYRWVTRTRTVCCEGWRGCYCHIPVCSGGCGGNGICVGPNNCYCYTGGTGNRCQYAECSWKTDCYPGTCDDPAAGTCICPASYGGDDCLIARDAPDITRCSVKLRDGNKNTFTGTCGVTSDNSHIRYINDRDITEIELDWQSYYNHYEKDGVVAKPGYLLDAVIGVVESYADVKLYTADDNVAQNRRVDCGLTNLNSQNPSVTAECLKRKINWDTSISHHYRLEIDMHTKTGGFKRNQDPAGGKVETVFTTEAVSTQSLHIIFDLEGPIHCREKGDCQTQYVNPLDIWQDITKIGNLVITWSGWIDDDSMVDYYEYTIYRMAINHENLLEEVWADPVIPKTKKVDIDISNLDPADNETEVEDYFPIFDPNEPGMYSVIVDVIDRAGNKAKARTLLLFDDENEVSITDEPIVISGVSINEAGLWIGTTQLSTDTEGENNLTISWKGHFTNAFLHENKFLNPSKPLYFSPGETDITQDEYKNSIYDDNYNNLTVKGIPNSHGIVLFKIKFTVDNYPRNWITTDIQDTISLNIPRQDGQKVTIIIEATDVFNNTKEDSVVAVIDSSPVKIDGNPVYEKGTTPDGLNYGSQIEMRCYDKESGIREIQFDISGNSSRRKKRELSGLTQEPQTLDPNSPLCQDAFTTSCYCTNSDSVCYSLPQYLYIDHCWFRDLPEREALTVRYAVLNNAGVPTRGEIGIGSPGDLPGIGVYQSIVEGTLNVSKETSESAEVNWVFPFSCYKVEGVRVVIQNDEGVFIKELTLREKVTSADILQLQPKTSYRVEAYVRYYNGENVLESISSGWVEFNTGDGDGIFTKTVLSEGVIVGIVFGMIILILIIIIGLFVVIRVARHQPPVPKSVSHAGQNIRNRFSTMYGTARDVEAHRMKRNQAYGNPGYKGHNELEDDDMYVYGNMETDSHASWKISPDRVILKHSVPNAKGRFANLCVANLVDKNGKVEVVAKMLKEGYTEDEKLLMKAKMNFFATEDLQHENVVRFLGACVDEPILLFEYCDAGTLSEWLKSQTSISGDVEEQFSSFSMAIARGVVYLHSKKVVHKRLGARNILLKENMGRLIPKLYGFGPLRGESDDKGDEAGQDKKEKIPIKWMAPEQFEKSPGKKRVYSKATDVWGYGIVLWEIYSKGESPYPDMSSSQVKAWLGKKNRLAKPRYAPDFLYDEILLKTWKTKPKDRPAMQDIHANLRKHFEGVGDGDEYYYDENGSSGDGLAKAKGGGGYYYTKQKMNNTGHSGIYDDTY